MSTPEGLIVDMKGFSVVIDEEDVSRIMARGPWRLHKGSERQYFVHTMPRPGHENLLLHRFIVGAESGFDVDHINGNEFDNRKSNLRICSHAENQRNLRRKKTNTSGYKGISFDQRRGLWRSRISIDNHEKWLGYFDTAEAAHAAYSNASKQFHGEFGRVE